MTTPVRESLPTNVRPDHYDVELEPDFESFKLSGKEKITVTVIDSTDRITLNALDITVLSASVESNGQSQVATVEYDEKLERITLVLNSKINTGLAAININFTGTLNDLMCGFYRSSYEVEGQKKWLASTQFEAVDSRRAFPCWDEPAVKATFSITLTTPADMEALSNMPSESVTTNDQGKKVFKFGKTPKMSTYIVAFAVGNFEYIEGHTKEGVLVRVYTTPGKKQLGQYSLAVAIKTLSYFNEYFDTPFPLSKVDMLAVPDFAAGAMENWGLITYREIALLIDEKQSPAARKMRVAQTVTHELAHQWFGNLVTMEWWTDLWLNEGFATWVADLALNHLFPEWKIWEMFLSSSTASAFGLDALESSHPIEVPVYVARKVDEIFDNISYAKGGSVIRMISEFLTESVFRDGLRIYLKRHAYSNAITDDLWRALGEASGQPVEAIMSSWTRKTGYPVIGVRQEGDELVLTQERFLSNGKRDKSTQWVVPITLKTSAGQSLAVVMDQAETRVKVSVPAGGWVKLNVNQAGFYRVHYESGLFQALCGALKSRQLSTMDRFGVVNDVFALAKAQYVSTADMLSLLDAMKNVEDEYVVVTDMIGSLLKTLGVFHGTPFYPQLQNFAREVINPIFAKIGWEAQSTDDHQRALLRSTLVAALGEVDEPNAVGHATKLFASPSTIAPDLKGPVFSIIGAHGGQDAFDSLLKLYRASEVSEEKVRLLRAMGMARDPAVATRVLDFGATPEVRAQDLVYLFSAVGSNNDLGNLAFTWLQKNWEKFMQQYGKGGFLLNHFISTAIDSFYTDADRQSVISFFEAHPVPSAEKSIAQSLEHIALNMAWRERDSAAVAQFLASHQQ